MSLYLVKKLLPYLREDLPTKYATTYTTQSTTETAKNQNPNASLTLLGSDHRFIALSAKKAEATIFSVAARNDEYLLILLIIRLSYQTKKILHLSIVEALSDIHPCYGTMVTYEFIYRYRRPS